MNIGPNITLLPDVALEHIFYYLSFDEIAKNRLVCKKFDNVGSNFLSRAFVQIERRHAIIYKRVKSLLPRRESERRVHPLFRHCDILSAVETRISMLNMTYMKYIQKNMCCFIPGKVLDELDRVLNVVERKGAPPKTHEILLELRDISSMAMEYFDEKILPGLKEQAGSSVINYSPVCYSANKGSKVYFMQPGIQDEIKKLTKSNKKQRSQLLILSRVVQKLYTRIEKQSKTIKHHTTTINKYDSKMQEQANKLQEHESTINELKKHVGDFDNKFSQLSSEIIRSKADIVKVLFPSISLLKTSTQTPGSTPRKTVIRPRISQVQTPNTYITELERKRKASIDFSVPPKLRFVIPREYTSSEIKERISHKFNENITLNISQKILDENYKGRTKKKSINISVDSLYKPSTSMNSRKRKNAHDIDFNNE